jgi:hypothetical protein
MNQNDSVWEMSIDTYPNEIYFGDHVYVVISLKNQTEKPQEVYYFDTEIYPHTEYGLKMTISDADDVLRYPVLFEERDNSVACAIPAKPGIVSPGNEVVVYRERLQFPPLEDMDTEFWKNVSFAISNGKSKELYLNCRYQLDKPKDQENPIAVTVRKKFTIKQRNEKETELLRTWYSESPEEIFPVTKWSSVTGNGRKYGKGEHGDHIRLEDKFIKFRDHQWPSDYFVSWANRTPPQGFCPETWQGWKELEESLTPSTMRDEIRLTRMIIQYCDTKDTAVLDELKEWFAGMNEVQRIVMTKSLLGYSGLPGRSFALEVFDSDKNFNRIVQEYDVTTKWLTVVDWLKSLKEQGVEQSEMQRQARDLGIIK